MYFLQDCTFNYEENIFVFGVYYFVKFTSATKTKIGSGYCGGPEHLYCFVDDFFA
jgi:hypothetical protein